MLIMNDNMVTSEGELSASGKLRTTNIMLVMAQLIQTLQSGAAIVKSIEDRFALIRQFSRDIRERYDTISEAGSMLSSSVLTAYDELAEVIARWTPMGSVNGIDDVLNDLTNDTQCMPSVVDELTDTMEWAVAHLHSLSDLINDTFSKEVIQ